MEINRKTVAALRQLGQNLPDNSNITLCVPVKKRGRVCHRFHVSGGTIHHSESHSDNFVLSGSGPLA